MAMEAPSPADTRHNDQENVQGTTQAPAGGKYEPAADSPSSSDRSDGLDSSLFLSSHNLFDAFGSPDTFDNNFVDSFVQDLGFNGAVPSIEAVDVVRQASLNLQDAIKNTPPPENVLWSTPNWQQPSGSDTNNEFSEDSQPNANKDASLEYRFTTAPPATAESFRFSPTGYLGDVSEDMASLIKFLADEPTIANINSNFQYPDPQEPPAHGPYTTSNAPAGRSPSLPRSSFANYRTAHPNLRLQLEGKKDAAIEDMTPSPIEPGQSQGRANTNQLPLKAWNFSPANPKKSPEHPWVRSSGPRMPQGTARTGKINKYNPEDHYVSSTRIVENLWQASNGTRFEYNKFGELDRQSVKLSIADMQAFLYENPAKPVLWIQTCPADSARRYNTLGSSKCRFKDCPASVYKNTIAVGILRVAIDEAWPSLGAERDPFHCAGFMHLYCAERFLDWRAVCGNLDVRVDDRVFSSEPNGRFAASLFNTRMAEVAARFIKYARHDAQHGTDKLLSKFPHYPPHTQPAGPPKDHIHTLTYAIMSTKILTMSSRRVEVLAQRGERGSHMQKHLGDLQQAVTERRAVAMGKKRKRDADHLGQAGVVYEDDDAEPEDDTDPVPHAPRVLEPASPNKRQRTSPAPSTQTFKNVATTAAPTSRPPRTNPLAASRTQRHGAAARQSQQHAHLLAGAAARMARRAALEAELARLEASSEQDELALGLASTVHGISADGGSGGIKEMGE